MNKEKQKIQKHLWNWKYSVKDVEELAPGMNFDLYVKVNKDSDRGYKVKVLTKNDDINAELTKLNDERERAKGWELPIIYDVIAVVSGSKKKFAGGEQKVVIFTTKHQEVFK